jgi:PelA/Pel-15E family pectate lyase
MKRLFSILGWAGFVLVSTLPAHAATEGRWATVLRQPSAWYASDEAKHIADNVLLYQKDSGGWPKNLNMTQPPAPLPPGTDPGEILSNIDNGATTTQLRFLALVLGASEDPRYRTAFDRGLDYLLAAQYPNGGWPQYYPLRTGYYTHITFNDDAMIRVLTLLREVTESRAPFAFVDAKRRASAAAALAKGLDCILRCQVTENGLKTAWCAQHDETTFAPAQARAYELPSLSGSESVGIVEYLMSLEHPTPEVAAAIVGAVNWFKAAKLTGIRVQRAGGDVLVIPDPNAPPTWARFYDLTTNQPFFCGRDGVKKDKLADIEQERRTGYSWYGNWPARLLETDYPAWANKWPQLVAAVAALPATGTIATSPAPWVPDLGNSTYKNPVIYADYSDPDVVRVGTDYYLVASSFTCVPGLPILHSKDLVNWTIVGHALQVQIPEDHFNIVRSGGGVWAPAIRFHAGKYYIFYPDPDYGIYVVTATDPAGEWSKPTLVKAGRGLIDPCPLWDDDGKVWLVHAWANSRSGRNNLLTLVPLNTEASATIGDGRDIIAGADFRVTTLEGPKFYKMNGYYWIFAPVGGVAGGTQAVFRSKTIEGPYEYHNVLTQGGTPTNGPHQGGLVDTPDGKEWWFVHFQDKGAYGRITHLEPVVWKADGWPVMGNDADGDGTGEPVLTYKMPNVGQIYPPAEPQTSDEFDSSALGLQWQWMANPQSGWSSLTAHPGWMRLFGQMPSPGGITQQPNLFLQKFPAPEFVVTIKVDLPAGEVGGSAGLVIYGQPCVRLDLAQTAKDAHTLQLVSLAPNTALSEANPPSVPWNGTTAYLRVTIIAGARCQFSYSADNVTFTNLDTAVPIAAVRGSWIGAKFGLYVLAPDAARPVYADFDWVHVEPLSTGTPAHSPTVAAVK